MHAYMHTCSTYIIRVLVIVLVLCYAVLVPWGGGGLVREAGMQCSVIAAGRSLIMPRYRKRGDGGGGVVW